MGVELGSGGAHARSVVHPRVMKKAMMDGMNLIGSATMGSVGGGSGTV